MGHHIYMVMTGSNVELHICAGYTIKQKEDVPEYVQLRNKYTEVTEALRNENRSVVAYFNRDKQMIKYEVAGKSNRRLDEYVQHKLDPDAKPQAVSATIRSHDFEKKRSITFYNERGETLMYGMHSGTTELTAEDKKWFDIYMDFSRLASVEEIKDQGNNSTLVKLVNWLRRK